MMDSLIFEYRTIIGAIMTAGFAAIGVIAAVHIARDMRRDWDEMKRQLRDAGYID